MMLLMIYAEYIQYMVVSDDAEYFENDTVAVGYGLNHC